MIYEQNYQRLKKLVADLETLPANCYRKSKSNGFMDLSFESLSRGTDQLTCAMAHYFEQNGDLIADPDMEIRVVLSMQMIEAHTYQDQFGFQVGYPEPEKVDLKAKKEKVIYRKMPKSGDVLSVLGFGCMRLPGQNEYIDEKRATSQFRYAIEHGVNYVDTAMPYHRGESEPFLGRWRSWAVAANYALFSQKPGTLPSTIPIEEAQ